MRPRFEQVFSQHAAYAWRVLRRFGVPERDVADVCQDVFLVVYRKLADFEGRSSLKTWIYGICARSAADYRKRAHRRYETLDHTRIEPWVHENQSRDLEARQTAAVLDEALCGLTEDKRSIFVLYELEELSMPEIASALGCPLKTAFTRLYAARRQVNAALRRAGCAAFLPPIPLFTRWREAALPQVRDALMSWRSSAPGAEQLGDVARRCVEMLGAQASVTGTVTASVTVGTTAKLSIGLAGACTAMAIALTVFHPNISGPPAGAVLLGGSNAQSGLLRTRHPLSAPSMVVPEARPSVTDSIEPAATSLPSRSTRPENARRGLPAKNSESVVAALAEPVGSEQRPRTQDVHWITAPRRLAADPAGMARNERAIGLGEVLVATSVRPLMRIAPAWLTAGGKPYLKWNEIDPGGIQRTQRLVTSCR